MASPNRETDGIRDGVRRGERWLPIREDQRQPTMTAWILEAIAAKLDQ